MRVAFIHDWLVTWRGGEKCLESLLEIYPDSDIYTLFSTQEILETYLKSKNVFSSCLSKLPFKTKYYRYLLPLYPLAVWDLSKKLKNQHNAYPYDLVISISHCVAKNVETPDHVQHVCYCLTPVRYIWDQFDNYFNSKWYRPIVSFIRNRFKNWDVSSSKRVTKFIAISHFVAQRIKNYYGRDSDIVYPPVSIERFNSKPFSTKFDYYLMVNALVPYKRTDLVVEAFSKLESLKLVIVGTGPELMRLKSVAASNVTFMGGVTDYVLEDLYRNCKALIFPALEDFGIAPVEAQASGRPILSLDKGGCAETVIFTGAEPSGLAIKILSISGVIDAINEFEGLNKKGYFKPEFCRNSADRFSEDSFRKNIVKSISEL